MMWLLLACTASQPVDTGPVAAAATCDASGGRQYWALTDLSFERVGDDGVTSDGFDLDDDVTDIGDSDGCGIADMVAPDGREGIDNAFARLIPILETTEFVGLEGIFEELIETGELLLVGEIAGAEDFVNDDCVTVGMQRAAGDPMLDTNGDVLQDQTLQLDPDFAAPQVSDVPIIDGSVEARPFGMALPITFLDASFTLDVLGGAVRYDIGEDDIVTGVFAGGLDTAWLLDLIATTGINDEVADVLEPVLGGMADLAPDDTGACTQISVTMEFSAVPVYVFE